MKRGATLEWYQTARKRLCPPELAGRAADAVRDELEAVLQRTDGDTKQIVIRVQVEEAGD